MDGQTYTTKDHQTIMRWIERRSGHAARVVGRHPYATTPFEPEIGALRISFPGYASEEKTEPMSWDDFFAAFDAQGFVFVYRETEDDGTMSYDYNMEVL